MSIYKHILIAADFSDHTDQVMQRALALAESAKSQFCLCHIVEDFPLTDFAYEPMISVDLDMRDSLLDAGRQQLASLGEKYHIPADYQWVESGSPGRDIVRIADEHNVDLIVVGSHGRHGIKMLLGSTANAILHHAHCDVLAVRLQDD
ncbi:Universal stress protein [Methylophaga frappieri]|uniref:Universal stress protein n=1 Tax=Methylophaga frappieri (strain ATCC BAA-2434 / DSM 25690 / JAM7) TaxID=754477 RepID=I1YIQ9_METFJ|nr:universal stress protein [Methylophaga frappieri]AFJ02802.1 Universal stress protein [Methylophaga frappieri]